MSQGYLVQIMYTLYWNIQVYVYYSQIVHDFANFLEHMQLPAAIYLHVTI